MIQTAHASELSVGCVRKAKLSDIECKSAISKETKLPIGEPDI